MHEKNMRLSIESAWAKEVLKIADSERLEAFVMVCLNRALYPSPSDKIKRFPWTEVQNLWERTEIIPITREKAGVIKLTNLNYGE